MNIKERILSMDKILVDKEYVDGNYISNVEELLLTVETTTSLYDMCCYLSEDCDYGIFLVLMNGITQCTSIKKEDIVTIGIYNGINPNERDVLEEESLHMYQ